MSGARARASWIAALVLVVVLTVVIALSLSREPRSERDGLEPKPTPEPVSTPIEGWDELGPRADVSEDDVGTSDTPTAIVPDPPRPGTTTFRLVPCATHDDPGLMVVLERPAEGAAPLRWTSAELVEPVEGDMRPLPFGGSAAFRTEDSDGVRTLRWMIIRAGRLIAHGTTPPSRTTVIHCEDLPHVRGEFVGPGAEAATVTLAGPEGPEMEAGGDSDGRFDLGPVSPTLVYTLDTTAPGAIDERRDAVVLPPGGNGLDLELRLQPAVRLDCTVLDEQGLATPAEVTVSTSGGDRTASSGVDGHVTFDGLRPREVTISARNGDWLSPRTEITLPADGPVTLHLRAGQFIEGVVVDEGGQPYLDGLVSATTSDESMQEVDRDAEGRFRVGPFRHGEVVTFRSLRSPGWQIEMPAGSRDVRLVIRRDVIVTIGVSVTSTQPELPFDAPTIQPVFVQGRPGGTFQPVFIPLEDGRGATRALLDLDAENDARMELRHPGWRRAEALLSPADRDDVDYACLLEVEPIWPSWIEIRSAGTRELVHHVRAQFSWLEAKDGVASFAGGRMFGATVPGAPPRWSTELRVEDGVVRVAREVMTGARLQLMTWGHHAAIVELPESLPREDVVFLEPVAPFAP